MIYLDYAATSGQKPESVYLASDHALRQASGNPGRSGHKVSMAAGQIVASARLTCSRFFHAENAESMIFCSNATDALNLAIHGVLKPGDHVITSHLEHNSVARPLEHAKDQGVEVTKLPTSLETGVNPDDVEAAIKENTKLVVMTHISNVFGTINDIRSIGAVCRKHHILFLVDAAQSVGIRNIDVQDMNIDLMAFPGHKCLYGPQGTGGLYVRPGVVLDPLKQGGTGSHSDQLHQPEDVPFRYESGTLNVPGIAGLEAGIRFLMDTGMDQVQEKETRLMHLLIEELQKIPDVTLFGPKHGDRGPVLSITLEGYEPQDVAIILDEMFDIGVRSGLHCAPDAHQAAGTLESGGTIRISPGYFTTEEEILACARALQTLTEE